MLPTGPEISMFPKRSECVCPCHGNSNMMHFIQCCVPDIVVTIETECVCPCHEPEVYNLDGTITVSFVSHGDTHCCDPNWKSVGSRVEYLPETIEPELFPTKFREDCRCDCHIDSNCVHAFPCCYNPTGPTAEDDDIKYFKYRMFRGLGLVHEFHTAELKVKIGKKTD